MCFHNSMSKRGHQLASRYSRKSDITEIYQDILSEQYHVNAFKFPKCPIITKSDEIQVFDWGLIPSWVKNKSEAEFIRKRTLNTRGDRIFGTPFFEESAMKKRCIMPSTGYFEWGREGSTKVPYYIYLKNEPIFSMAGIYNCWIDRNTGEGRFTFAIITTESNSLGGQIRKITPRMPVILQKEKEEYWLDPCLSKEDVCSLLVPYEANKMDAYQVNSDFMKKKPTDPSIIERV